MGETQAVAPAPDTRFTKVGRSLLIALAVLTLVLFGQYFIAAVSGPLERSENGASWLALLLALMLLGEGAAIVWGVFRDRRVGDTTGGLGVVVLSLIALNLVAFVLVGGLYRF